MPDHRPWGGLLLGLGLVWLALGLRLGLVGLAQGLGWQRLALGSLLLGAALLGVALLGVALLTRPASGQPAPRPSRRRRGLSVGPASLREEWGGDLAEACWQWHQRGSTRWSIRLWTLSWMLQLVETRVRCAFYEAIWAHRWKKP
jgi:hypothetical protein